MALRKNVMVYFFSIILIIFGFVGAVFSFSAISLVAKYKIDIDSASELNSSIDGGVESISNLLSNTSTAMENVSVTVNEVKNSIVTASDLTYVSADAIYEIADLANFDILGFQPFGSSYEYFIVIGDSLKGLSGSIDKTVDSIGTNADDIEKIARDLEEASLKLNNAYGDLSKTVETFPDLGLKKVINYLLIYCGILNLMFVFMGASLLLLAKGGKNN